MSSDRRAGVRVIVSAVAVLIASASASAQRVINVPQSRPELQAARIQEAFDEAVPLVERVAQRKFKKPPQLKIITANEATVMFMEAKLREMQAHPTKASGQDGLLSDREFASLSSQVGGFYSPDDKVVYVIPAYLGAFSQALQWGRERFPAYLRHVLAHELTHALQDEEKPLPEPPVEALDVILAHRALIEGLATYVTSVVDALLGNVGIDGQIRARIEEASKQTPQPASPKEAGTRRALRILYERCNYSGSQFIDAIHDLGGMEKVWALFDAPPSDMGMILYPEQYSPRPRLTRDYSRVFDGADKELGQVPAKMVVAQLGPWVLEDFEQEVRQLQDQPEARKIIDDHAITCLVATAFKAPGRGFWNLTLLEGKSQESAGALEHLFKEFRKTALLTTDDVTPSRFNTQGKRIADTENTDRDWYGQFRQGRFVLLFSGWYEDISRESVEDFARTVWKRLDAMDSRKSDSPKLGLERPDEAVTPPPR